MGLIVISPRFMRQLWSFFIFSSFLFCGCKSSGRLEKKEIIVFHAGSLSVPLSQLKTEYEKLHPGVNILLESAGSLICARKITELKKPCDMIASADYFVINELLIPEYTSWSIRFATNEIVIAFSDKSKYSAEINQSNWMNILQKEDVIYSRSDPDSDPCGYRTIFTFKLAENYYNLIGLAQRLADKNKDFIRPKEVDLVALLESNAIDYMFQYKSVAMQHKFKFIELPDHINLSDPARKEIYRSVWTEVTGTRPGTKMKVSGDFINYSISVLDKAPQRDAAIDFLSFILGDKGKEIFMKNGQNPLVPLVSDQPDQLPEKLRQFLP
jgi:molybdate/tungstate transport system substrate-binding protein